MRKILYLAFLLSFLSLSFAPNALAKKSDVAFYNRGIAYAAQGQYAQAISEYNKAGKLKPQDADANNNKEGGSRCRRES